MLKVEMHDAVNAFLVKLQGRFAGGDVDYIRDLITRSHIDMKLVVELTDLTFVDGTGEETLQFFARLGAEFLAANSYSLDICERLGLPLAAAKLARGCLPVSGGPGLQTGFALDS